MRLATRNEAREEKVMTGGGTVELGAQIEIIRRPAMRLT